MTTLHLHGNYSVKWSSGATSWSYILLSPNEGLYASLKDINPNVATMATMYEQFMITSVSLKCMPLVAVGLPAQWYYAVGYEPEDTGESKQPSNFADVITSRHSKMIRGDETAQLQFNPSQYRSEWCSTSVPNSTFPGERRGFNCGYVQILSNNTAGAVVNAETMLVEVSYTITFAGLKAN